MHVEFKFIYKVQIFVVEKAMEYPRKSGGNLQEVFMQTSHLIKFWQRGSEELKKVFDCKQTGIYLRFEPVIFFALKYHRYKVVSPCKI